MTCLVIFLAIYFGGLVITAIVFYCDDPFIDTRYIIVEMASLILWPVSLPMFCFRRLRRRKTKGYWKE